MFAYRDIVGYAVLAGVLAAAAVAATRWGRRPTRLGVAALGTIGGWTGWYAALNTTHAAGFNTDAPVIALSWADAGSGLTAFVVIAAVLAVTERAEPAGRVVGAAALAGLVATLLDLFVL